VRRPLVGVFGGTFDPVHRGHLGIAREAAAALGLSRVDLVPSFQPPHRPGHEPAAAHHRFAMIVLATQSEPLLFPSDREIRRGGLSYMIETLRGYALDEPGVEPVLLLGADAFAEFGSWKEPRAIVEEFRVTVVSRAGSAAPAPPPGAPPWLLAAWGERIGALRLSPYPVSASGVRERLGRGEAVAELVGAAVARYIERQKLYGTASP
jgi:nicotinate-nucleotide adenylyltransferase